MPIDVNLYTRLYIHVHVHVPVQYSTRFTNNLLKMLSSNNNSVLYYLVQENIISEIWKYWHGPITQLINTRYGMGDAQCNSARS